MIQATIKRLNEILVELPGKIKRIPEDNLNAVPLPGKWSKKEILGHLCDSAVNNLSRIIMAQYGKQPFPVIKYHQEDWVRINGYRDQSIDYVLNLWATLNRQFIQVISRTEQEKLNYTIDSDGEFHTLGWLIEDYLKHMEHHLEEIFEQR